MAEMRGLKELIENLEGLKVTARSACRGATNAAAQVVRREAVIKARAQGLVQTGALVKNIAVARERGTSPTYFEYHIGVRHGLETKGAQKIAIRGKDGRIRFQYTGNPFYWWFWEFGHYNVFLRAQVPAKPFIRPAIDSKAPELLGVMKDYLGQRLLNTMNKALA
jgi:HK97 gp10 family phage protein